MKSHRPERVALSLIHIYLESGLSSVASDGQVSGSGPLDLEATTDEEKVAAAEEVAIETVRLEEAGEDAKVFLHEATEGVSEVDSEPRSHKLDTLKETEEPLGVSEFSQRSAGGQLEAGEDDIEATRSK